MHKINKFVRFKYLHISSGWTGTAQNINTLWILLINLEYNLLRLSQITCRSSDYISQLITKSVELEGNGITRRHFLQCLVGKTRTLTTQTYACQRENALQHVARTTYPTLTSTDNWQNKMILGILPLRICRITTKWRKCLTTGFPKK